MWYTADKGRTDGSGFGSTLGSKEAAMSEIPKPGSDEALGRGCTCPVLDNVHGQGVWGGDGETFWISENCPLHGVAKKEATQ